MGVLRKIPNIGEVTERDLNKMGYSTVESLKGVDPQELYEKECALRGCIVDRCQLYLYRAVAYYVNSPSPDLKKVKWHYFKDEYVLPAPCGTVCFDCEYFPAGCKGCRAIKGKVFWLEYTGGAVCDIFDCCVNEKGKSYCGGCEHLPCKRFDLDDPNLSKEENERMKKSNIERLQKLRGGC